MTLPLLQINQFLATYDIDLICRAHMVVEDGYEFWNERTLVTVFSAPVSSAVQLLSQCRTLADCSVTIWRIPRTTVESEWSFLEPARTERVTCRIFYADRSFLFDLPGSKTTLR